MTAIAAQHEHWSGRIGFLLASIGSAVGLGNFWRFTYEAGENGGGAFVLVYLVCVFLLITPLLLAELVIGRRGQESAAGSVAKIAREAGATTLWRIVGIWGILGGLLVLSFYSVIGGWVIVYIPDALAGAFSNSGKDEAEAMFGALFNDPVRMLIGHAIFMGLTIAIVLRGVRGGIETATEILMPLLFLMLIGLVIYGVYEGDFPAALDFLFAPDFAAVTPKVFLAAIGQAFFSVGVGLGLMITYGSYVGQGINLTKAALTIAAADTAVAILAGLAIFPIVFGSGLEAGQGPGLMFVTLPIALGALPFGDYVGAAFFFLLFVAAITSSISLLELGVAWVAEWGLGRLRAALVTGGVVFLVGVGAALSFNVWSDLHPFEFLPTFEGKNIFDSLDHLTADIMLPVGGLLVALFAGWVLPESAAREELSDTSDGLYRLWRFLVKFVTPVAIAAILVSNYA